LEFGGWGYFLFDGRGIKIFTCSNLLGPGASYWYNHQTYRMKTNSCLSAILVPLLALFFAVPAPAQDNGQHIWPVKLQKEYTKTYPVGTETVALMNRYGKMVIETWDKNEVKVEAHISVGAQTNEYATKILELLTIADEKTSDRISYITKVGGWNDNSNGGHELKVDYTVHLPANAKLVAENDYGPLTIGDYKGEAELYCRYGTLTAGKLSNSKSITVEYGRAKIESVSDSKLFFRYTRVDIEKLSGKITGGFEYCNSVDMPVDNTLKELELKTHYTNLYLLFPKDFSGDYDILTNNARVTAKNDWIIKEELSNPNNGRTNNFSANHKYAGSLGKGGGTMINIKSNYGNIRVI
jgi:hypothetical protein